MKADDLRTLAADHGAIRADVWRVSAALESAAVEIERLRAALADIDILAEYGGSDDDWRDWANVGCWLKPGEVIAHMDDPRSKT